MESNNKNNKQGANRPAKSGSKAFDKKSSRNASKRTNRPQRDESIKTTAGKRSNSPEWYKIDDNIMKGVASYPFARRVGDSDGITVDYTVINSEGTATKKVGVSTIQSPGVMTVEWIPSIGVATSATDPINQIAQRVYNYVRHANSGSSAYDASDLMMYILSVTSCFNWWCTLRRAYGVLRWASPMNRYLPKALVEAMGFKYDEIAMHPTRLLDAINFIAIRMKSFCIPAGMTAVIRQAWLNSNVFADGMEEKAQYYVPMQRAYYVLRENFELGTPGLLEAKSPWFYSSGLVGFDKIEEFTNTLVQPLLTSEDFMTMGGDIRKAFGVQNLFWLESTPMDFVVLPDFNPEVLYQIENAMTPFITDPVEAFLNKFQITQDPNSNIILANLRFKQLTNAAVAGVRKAMVNMPMDNPSPDEVTVATRLITLASYNSTSKEIVIDAGGTELVTGYRIVYAPGVNSGTGGTKSFHFGNFIPYSDKSGEATYDRMSAIAAFNHHPTVYFGFAVGSNMEWSGPVTNLQNWTLIEYPDLQRINTMCMYAEYNVPGMQD